MASERTVLDPVFVVNGRKRSLPWILHALEDGRRLQFDHLRPHQEHAWHLFLVRTAAMLGPTDDWNLRLRAEGDIWDIYPESGKCGFFQPAGQIEDGYKPRTYVEEEDTPKINGPNHRYKTHLPTALDYWLYALISAQTTSRHETWHRQSIRTSSGYGDRPYISKVHSLSWAGRFASDVALARTLHGAADGIQFLWAWVFQDYNITLEDCHPLMVDSSRRYRMKDGIMYYNASYDWPLITESSELDAVTLKDPWLPVKGDGTAQGTPNRGFRYDIVQKYLAGGDVKTPALQQEMEEDCYFIAQTIAGGKGGSKGIHRRVVKLPADLSDALFPEDDTFDRRSKQYVRSASKVKQHLLNFPLIVLFAENDDNDDDDRPLAEKILEGTDRDLKPSYSEYRDRYEARVDQEFFPHLFENAEDEMGVERWKNHLCSIAEDLFEEALQSCYDWEQKASADTIFRSRISDLRTHEPESSGVPN